MRNGAQCFRRGSVVLAALSTLGSHAVALSAPARADNKRLNDGVVANVYTIQHQAGCANDVTVDPRLQQAAQWHTDDLMANRNLDGDAGSDGSSSQSRAAAAGYPGKVAQTVAINPALAISGIELLNQWYNNPDALAIMRNCSNTRIGVWSENSVDRTVVVAVYGQSPLPAIDPSQQGAPGPAIASAPGTNVPIDPSPDYDASDELEYGINWFPWILRGVYPPPDYPPN